MKRRAIEAVPMLKRMLSPTKEEYTVFSQLLDTGQDKILILDFYKTRPLEKRKKLLPQKRYVTDKKDFETYFPGQEKPWTKASLKRLNYMPSMLFPKGAAAAVYEYLPKPSWGDEPERRLSEHESRIKDEKSRQKKLYHQNAINRRISQVQDYPPGAEAWCLDLFKDHHFIFYETINQQRAAGICSKCLNTIEYDRTKEKPRHNKPCCCPNCHTEGIFKAKGKQGEIQIRKKVIIMQKIEGGFVSRYLDLEYRGSSYGEHLFGGGAEVARATYNGKRVYYDYYDSYMEKWTDSNISNVQFGRGYLYTANLPEVFSGTRFQYCALSELQNHTGGPVNQKSFLEHYESRPFLEYMIKMGLYRLTEEYLDNICTPLIDGTGKHPGEVLRLPKEKIRALSRADGGLDLLKRYQIEHQLGRVLTEEEMNIILTYRVDTDSLLWVKEFTGITRFLRYLVKQVEMRNEQYAGYFINDWLDYLRMYQSAGLELNNSNMFPENLKEEHDKHLEAIKTMQEEENNRKYQTIRKQYEERYSFSWKGLCIKVPASLADIVTEGNEQHHCVATYVDRVAAGETCILFVRKKKEPDQSFYTMEIKDSRIIQCRGKNNRDQTQEVEELLKKFKQYLEDQKLKAIRSIPA